MTRVSERGFEQVLVLTRDAQVKLRPSAHHLGTAGPSHVRTYVRCVQSRQSVCSFPSRPRDRLRVSRRSDTSGIAQMSTTGTPKAHTALSCSNANRIVMQQCKDRAPN